MANGYFPNVGGNYQSVNAGVYATTVEPIEFKNETVSDLTEIPIPEGISVENKKSLMLMKEITDEFGKKNIEHIGDDDYMIDLVNDKIILLVPLEPNDKIIGKVFNSIDIEGLTSQILTDFSSLQPKDNDTLRYSEELGKYVPQKASVRSITENIGKVIDTSQGEVTEILVEPGQEFSTNVKPIIIIDGVPYSTSKISSILPDRIILTEPIPQDAVAEIIIFDTKDIPTGSLQNFSDVADESGENDDVLMKKNGLWTPTPQSEIVGTNDLTSNDDIEKTGEFLEGQTLYVNSNGKFTNISHEDIVTPLINSLIQPLQDAVDSVVNIAIKRIQDIQNVVLINGKDGQVLVKRGNVFTNEFLSGTGIPEIPPDNNPPPPENYIETLEPVYTQNIPEIYNQYETDGFFHVQNNGNQLENSIPSFIFIDGLLHVNTFDNPEEVTGSNLFKITPSVGNDISFLENSSAINIQGFYSDKYNITPALIQEETLSETNQITISGTFDPTDLFIVFINNAHQTPTSYTKLDVLGDMLFTFSESILDNINIDIFHLPTIGTNIQVDTLDVSVDQTEFTLTTIPNTKSSFIIFDGPYYVPPSKYYIREVNNNLKLTVPVVSNKLTVYHLINATI